MMQPLHWALGHRAQPSFFICNLPFILLGLISMLFQNFTILWRASIAFFRTRSVEWDSSFTTESIIAPAIVLFMIRSIQVKQMTISWILELAKSFWIVEISMIVRSELPLRKREQRRYPNLFSTRFLFWVRLIASIWQNEAEWPSISMYMATIRYYLIFFCDSPFSLSLGFKVLSSFRIILSSYCLDFVSPILLISYWSYFDNVDDEVILMFYNYRG